MNKSTLLDEIMQLVRRLGRVGPHVELTRSSRLVEDLAIDSLDLVGMILQIQDDYGVVIEDDDVTMLRTIAELTSYVEARRENSAAA